MTTPTARPGVYPMTYEQESLWLDDHLDSGPCRYLESWACRLVGLLDIDALEWAINQIVMRHEVLRSRLILRGSELVQVVAPARPVSVQQVRCAPTALSAEFNRISAEPLDLDEAPLRPWLLQVSPEEFLLVVQFHHAVVDDWALGIFQREFGEFYTARVRDQAPNIESLPLQVGDYAVAQRAAGINPADLAYWRKRVEGAPRSCTVPPDLPRPQSPRHNAGQHRFRLSPELGRTVRAASRARRTTPYTVFAAATAALLELRASHAEVIFGTPVSRRGSAAVDGMIGCLTDLLPLRLAVPQDVSFGTLIDAAKAEVIGAMQHKNVPYATLLRLTRRRSEEGMLPLCLVALVVDDARYDSLSLPGITADRVYVPPSGVKFDVCLTLVIADDGGYLGFCDYAAELYRAATIARVASQFTDVLSRGLAAADQPLTWVQGSSCGARHD